MPPISPKQNIDFEKLNIGSAEFAEYLRLAKNKKEAFVMKATSDANKKNAEWKLKSEEAADNLHQIFVNFENEIARLVPVLPPELVGRIQRLKLNPKLLDIEDSFTEYYENYFAAGVLKPRIDISSDNAQFRISTSYNSHAVDPVELTVSKSNPILGLRDEMLRVRIEISDIIETLATRNFIPKDQAAELQRDANLAIENMKRAAIEEKEKLVVAVSEKQTYLQTREELYKTFQRKQRDDYYSQVVNNQATSDKLNSDPKFRENMEKEIRKRKDNFDARVTRVEIPDGSTGSLTDSDIIKLQEEIVLPPYVVRELKSIRGISHTTAEKLRNEPISVYVDNRGSVLPTNQYTPSKKRRNWVEYKPSSSNRQINLTSQVPIASTLLGGNKVFVDTGFVGEGFDVEYSEMVWDMVDDYKKRCIETDKTRRQLAEIIYLKKNLGRRPPEDSYQDMPLLGNWTIADELDEIYSDFSKSEKTKVDELKLKLANQLLGEPVDPKDPGKIIKKPLLTEAIRIKRYLKAMGYDDVRLDYSNPDVPADTGDLREAIFDPLQSATSEAQRYRAMGKQLIDNDGEVSQFVFNIGNDESGNNAKQLLPTGILGRMFDHNLSHLQVEDSTGVKLNLRTNTGFVNKEAWKLLDESQNQNIKISIEESLRADMYRKYAEDRLSNQWKVGFRAAYLQSLKNSGLYGSKDVDEIEKIVNKNNKENVRRDARGEAVSRQSNIDYLAEATLESMSRQFGFDVAKMQSQLAISKGFTDISALDVRELSDLVYERFSERGFQSTIETALDLNNNEIKTKIDDIRNNPRKHSGYFLPLRQLSPQEIDIALTVGKHLGKSLLSGASQNNLEGLRIISNLGVILETDNNSPRIKYRENRAVSWDGKSPKGSKINYNEVIKVYKDLTAVENPSALQIAVLGELNASMSPKMMKLLSDVGGSWQNEKTAAANDRNKDIGKLGVETAGYFTKWYQSWIPGMEKSDVAIDALIKNRNEKWTNINIFNPELMADSILRLPNQGFGWGAKFKDDFSKWTFGEKSAWIDPSRFINPLTEDKLLSIRDNTGFGLGLQGIDNWKKLLDGSKGGLFGHMIKTGQLPSLEIPFTTKVIIGNKAKEGIPFVGAGYEVGKSPITIISDMAGKPLAIPKGSTLYKTWAKTRFQYMVGLRRLENGQEVTSIGSFFTKRWDKWETGIDKIVDSNIGKALKLNKRNSYKKRKDQNLIKELVSLGFNITEGAVEYILVGAGKVILATPILGSGLKAIGNLEVVKNSVSGISNTLEAFKASIPLARATTVGLFNTALVGAPIYLIAGGGIPGVLLGVGAGGLWGVGAGLNSLQASDIMKRIETFMGFDRLENPALMQTALAEVSDNNLIRRVFGADGKTFISGIKNNSELFQQSLKWENVGLENSGYVRWLSPHGWYGKMLTRVYNYVGGESKAFDNALLAPYKGAGSALESTKNVIGAVSRGALVGTAVYLWTGNPILGALGLAGFGAVEYAARAMMPAIAVKLQFLGETAAGARIANALTTANYFRVAFPILDTIGLVQSTDFFNQALAIPTYQMLRGQLPLDVYAFGGTSQINLWNISVSEAKLYGISENEYYSALRKSEQTGLVPVHTIYYDGVLTRTMFARVAFNLGLGYIPMASAYSARIFTLANKLGVKNVWGTWYANKFETIPGKSILSWMKDRGGILKLTGDAIDNPFGRYGGTVAKVGGSALGAFGGFELAISLGITNPVGIAAMTVGGGALGYFGASALSKAGGFFYDNVLTGWMRVPLAAGGGLVSLAAPLIGGTIGGLVAQIGGFGTGGYIAATLVGTVVGAILIPGIGGLLGVVIGSAVSAVASYGAAYVGDWIGNWWTKTTNFAIDSLKSISPVLALVRLFKAIDDADLGRFIGALMSFAMSFSVGMVTVGAVVSFVPPLITPAAVAPAATGGFFLPVGKLVDKTFIIYDKASNKLKYNLVLNPGVLGIYNDTATITMTDTPQDASNIVLITSEADSVCAKTANQFSTDGKKITLKDSNFDKARMTTSICVEYYVTPTKALADYSTQFCNEFSAVTRISTATSDTDYGGLQCVSNKGIDLGQTPFGVEGDLGDGGGQNPQTSTGGPANPIATGTGFFPVDPTDSKVGGCQCAMGGSSHNAGGVGLGALDICGPQGTNVMAWNDGIVTGVGYTSYNSGIYGLMITIVHPAQGNLETWYAHTQTALVKVGDSVKGGQVIALMGASTGTGNRCMYSHLHFETRFKGTGWSPNPCTGMIDCLKYKVTPATSFTKCFSDPNYAATAKKTGGPLYEPSAFRSTYNMNLTKPSTVVNPNDRSGCGGNTAPLPETNN